MRATRIDPLLDALAAATFSRRARPHAAAARVALLALRAQLSKEERARTEELQEEYRQAAYRRRVERRGELADWPLAARRGKGSVLHAARRGRRGDPAIVLRCGWWNEPVTEATGAVDCRYCLRPNEPDAWR